MQIQMSMPKFDIVSYFASVVAPLICNPLLIISLAGTFLKTRKATFGFSIWSKEPSCWGDPKTLFSLVFPSTIELRRDRKTEKRH